MEKRIIWIDLGRFIAIFLVTGFHVWRFIGCPEHMVLGIDLWGFFKNGYMGCDLFFLLSGYLCSKQWDSLHNENNKVLKFYLSKALRIIPAYYVSLLFWWFLVNKGICVKPYGVRDVIMHMLFMHTLSEKTFFSTSGVYWYLGVQMHFYILFPLALYILNKVNNWVALAISFLPVVILSYTGYNDKFTLYWNVILLMPSFVCGIMLQKGCFDCFRKETLIFLSLFLYFGIVLVPKIQGLFFLADRLVVGISIGIVLYELADWSKTIPKSIKVFVGVIAQTSYSIYLYNYIFTTYNNILVGKTGFVIYVFMTFGFGIIMYYVVENSLNGIIKRIKMRYCS